MTIEIVDLPIDSMVIFHSYVNVYQRVDQLWPSKVGDTMKQRIWWFGMIIPAASR